MQRSRVNSSGETPLRAWGKRCDSVPAPCHDGNTPTGVGKTPEGHEEWDDHPETPPRAWGKLHGHAMVQTSKRNTPTGVGKTKRGSTSPGDGKKHPHGRGENVTSGKNGKTESETPPRAWGKPDDYTDEELVRGNTPTGVGKTATVRSSAAGAEKHPHGRGENRSEDQE